MFVFELQAKFHFKQLDLYKMTQFAKQNLITTEEFFLSSIWSSANLSFKWVVGEYQDRWGNMPNEANWGAKTDP